MLMRFAKTNSWVQANPLTIDPDGPERLCSFRHVRGNFLDNVFVAGIDLHGLRIALHVHDANGRAEIPRNYHHVRIALKSADVVDDFGTGVKRSTSDR